jgi:hypothetical protein
LFAIDSFEASTDDGVPARRSVEMRLATLVVVLWAHGSTGGRAWVAIEGEADAARRCSSRLGEPTNWDGEGAENAGRTDLGAAWNWRVDASGGCWAGRTTGIGRAASSKCWPL